MRDADNFRARLMLDLQGHVGGDREMMWFQFFSLFFENSGRVHRKSLRDEETAAKSKHIAK